MSIELRPLDTLDPAAVQQELDEVIQRIVEDNPQLDLRFGVLFNLLGYYHAILAAQLKANVDDYLSARSLKAINADPTLADPALVDDVLSNYRLDRLPGTFAAGQVTMVMRTNTTVTIGAGTIFEASGQQFAATATFTAKADAAQINSPNDRLFLSTADGKFMFTITVEALLSGPEGKIAKDTTVIPVTRPNGYLSSYAASDFSDGVAAETNEALMERLQLGAATRDLSNRTTMQSLLRNTPEFAGFVTASIVGYGDPEMLRDRHSIFPVSMGGRVDWYIRTTLRYTRSRHTMPATLVSVDVDGYGIWQLSIGRDVFPGFYEVAQIHLAGTNPNSVLGGFDVLSDVRAIDLTGLAFAPDIVTVAEGVFSRYQTAIVQFKDTATIADNIIVGSRADYDVELRGMVQIGDIQDTMASRDVRHYGADCLVKAPIPCFVTISLTLYKRSTDPMPDLDAIRNTIADTVNGVGFLGRLYASILNEAIAPLIGAPTAAGRIDMIGRLVYPALAAKWLRSYEVLTVPDDPANMIGSRTVQFFCLPEDVGVTVSTSLPLDP